MKKNVIILAAAILLVSIAVYQNISSSQSKDAQALEAAAKPGFLAPAFSLQDISGKSFTVGGERDKPLVVNFWASWCDPCKAEAPHLVELYNRYQDRFDLYAVNATQLDTQEDAEKFAKQYAFPFPVLLDKKGKAIDLYQIDGFPISFLIDRHGVIQDMIVGLVSPQEMERKITALFRL
ncbi:MAG TPA: TlpA disulfide reductase family protein [Bacilli bacterium]